MIDGKQQIINNIQRSFYKNRGDIVLVASELDYPLPYVSSICSKLVRRLQMGIEKDLPRILVEKILLGYTHRVTTLNKDLDQLSKSRVSAVSECCGANVKSIVGKEIIYICQECKCKCNVYTMAEITVQNQKGKLIDRLRKEDELLLNLIEKTGIRFDTSVTVTKTEELKVTASNVPELDPTITKNFTLLNATDRGKIIKQLVKKIDSESK